MCGKCVFVLTYSDFNVVIVLPVVQQEGVFIFIFQELLGSIFVTCALDFYRIAIAP